MSAGATTQTVSISYVRKRTYDDGEMEPSNKRPRYYFRLESETSHSSEEDTESVCSIQDKETDAARDTSDTEAGTEVNSEFEFEIEYEVGVESDEEYPIMSSSEEEGMVLAAAAAICNSSLETFVTDGEESDSSSLEEPSFSRKDFLTCVQCKAPNENPGYRYCDKCFQDRKTFFPPRPRRKRSRPNRKKSPVKLDTLRSCLSGLSQDSGLGSSQECPSLNLDQIIVPKHLTSSPSTSLASKDVSLLSEETPNNSQSCNVSTECVLTSTKDIPSAKVSASTSSKSEEVPSSSKENEIQASSECDLKSESSTVTASSLSVDTAASSVSTISSNSQEREDSQSSKELCIICNATPKNGIFIHGRIAHMCCCYQCAMRTWRTIKRCPICKRKVNNVLKLYTL